MLMPNQTENIDASDPLCMPDTFVEEGIASITRVGRNCVRVKLYATRGGDEKVLVARLVWPASVVGAASEQLRTFIENGAFMAASTEGLAAN